MKTKLLTPAIVFLTTLVTFAQQTNKHIIYWTWQEHIDKNVPNSDYIFEGWHYEKKYAKQIISYDSLSEIYEIIYPIIITKVIKGKDIKVGDVIQLHKREYSAVVHAGIYFRPNILYHFFTKNSSKGVIPSQFPEKITKAVELTLPLSFYGTYNSQIKLLTKPFTSSTKLDSVYKYMSKIYRIKFNHLPSNVNLDSILKADENTALAARFLENQKKLELEQKNLKSVDTTGSWKAGKEQREFWSEHVRLFKEYQQYQLDSAKTPGLKWKPNRTKILRGKKVQGDTGTFNPPTNNSDFKMGSSPINVTPLSSTANMTFEIKNIKNTITSTSGINQLEFDVTGKTDGNGVFHSQTLHHIQYNPAIFGSNVFANGKMTVTNGALFTSTGNNYTVIGFDANTTSLGVSQQAYDVSITGTGTTTSAIYNLVQLPQNQTITLYHVSLSYNWTSSCGANTMIDFTNTFFTSLVISSTYSPNKQGTGNLSYYSTVTHAPVLANTTPLCTPSITGITHVSSNFANGIRAGTDDYIIVSGVGFGTLNLNATSSGFYFLNANSDGIDNSAQPDFFATDIEDIVSWTDTEIRVKAPTFLNYLGTNQVFAAGSGSFKIRNSLNSETISPTNIKVDIKYGVFSVKNGTTGNLKLKQNLVKKDCISGIEFSLSNTIENHPNKNSILACINQAMADWQNYLGIEVKYKKIGINPRYSTNTNHSNDGENIITIGTYPVLGVSVMANLYSVSRFVAINSNNGLQLYKTDNDIVIDKGTSWNYSIINTISSSQNNFYVAFRHELGHALGLAHVIDEAEMMHFQPISGNTDNFTSGRGMAGIGATDIKTTSQTITWYPSLGSTSIGTLGSTTPTPVIYSNYPTPTVCGLTAQLNSSPNLNTYQWRNNGINIPNNLGGTSAYYNVSSPGKYDLLGSLNGCTVVSNVVTITQIGLPVVNYNVAYSAVPYCVGSISITSNSANTIQWYYPNNYAYYGYLSNQPMSGQTGTSLVAALADIQLSWRVAATNCAGTSNTYIPVNAKTIYAPTVSMGEYLLNSGACNYASNLVANTINGAISYQWYRNDNNAWVTQTGWNTQSIIGNYQNIGKDYKVDVSNACGTATSSTLRLKTICAGCSVYVSASSCPNGLREGMEESTQVANSGIQTLKIYPNPATTALFIESNNEISGLEIINTSGTVLIKNSFSNQKLVSIDISSFAEGVYVCKISTNNDIVLKKIVVTK